ncbi:MAG: hypothetical protein V7678_04265 [Brevundimonas sp.]
MSMSTRVCLVALVAVVGGCAPGLTRPGPSLDAAQVRGPVYADPPPMNATVTNRLVPQMQSLLEQLLEERRDMTLDGVRVFEAEDKFLPGKIAIGMAHLLLQTPRDDPDFQRYLSGYGEIARMTLEDRNDSWGIYYYISALHRLEEAGLLEEAVDAQTLAQLQEQLDWRTFVREDDLTLIDLPNNYYGVAYSIARLRYLLGWEDASASEALLTRTLDHFREYSGEYGFADETPGDGRFDRYSVLLIGEIAQRFIEGGIEPPPEVREWLRQSVEVLLPRLNLRGEGFEYGRSIGAYGETAFLEVLSAAAALDVLTDEEMRMAYAFSSRVTARYADFWLDPVTGSVNLWDHGRRTDAYRGKHRILGENLSLAHQHFYTNAVWNDLGYRDRAPDPEFAAWLEELQRSTTTWFARGDYDRLLVTYRDGARVIGLPLINGAAGQHMHNPYFPIPYSPGVIQGVADETFPLLVPRVTLADGSQLMPLAWFEDVNVQTNGDRTIVTYRLAAADRMGSDAPVRDERMSFETRYVLEPGRITRTDRYIPSGPLGPVTVDLVFPAYQTPASSDRSGAVFTSGAVQRFSVEGLDCRTRPAAGDPVFETPVGPYRSVTTCSAEGRVSHTTWRLDFTPRP